MVQLSEMNDLMNFQHLVKYLEQMSMHRNEKHTMGWSWSYEEPGLLLPPDGPSTWRERFHRAMYRVFLAGAVLYESYNEPFSSKTERPANVPRECLRKYDVTRDTMSDEERLARRNLDLILPRDSAQFLRRFTVYNSDATEEEERAVFGTFAQWLYEDGKSLAGENQCPAKWHLDPSEASALWETTCMIRAFWLLEYSGIVNGDGQARHARPNPDGDDLPRRQSLHYLTRGVTIVPFGTFGLEHISMVSFLGADDAMVANPAKVLQDSSYAILDREGFLVNPDISSIHDQMFRCSGFSNHNDTHTMSTPDLQLYKYILKAHFDLQFGTLVWERTAAIAWPAWDRFNNDAAVFHPAGSDHGNYGFELLEKHRPRILSYRCLRPSSDY